MFSSASELSYTRLVKQVQKIRQTFVSPSLFAVKKNKENDSNCKACCAIRRRHAIKRPGNKLLQNMKIRKYKTYLTIFIKIQRYCHQ